MIKQFIDIQGNITESGQFMFNNQYDMVKFCKENSGKAVIGTLRVFELGTTKALRGYYFIVVVPKVRYELYEQQGLSYTEAQTEVYLREQFPFMYNEEANVDTGKYESILRGISELNNSEMYQYIEFIKMWCAEHLSMYIEDPIKFR